MASPKKKLKRSKDQGRRDSKTNSFLVDKDVDKDNSPSFRKEEFHHEENSISFEKPRKKNPETYYGWKSLDHIASDYPTSSARYI